MFLFTDAMIMQKIQRDKHAYTDVHHTHTHTHTHTHINIQTNKQA